MSTTIKNISVTYDGYDVGKAFCSGDFIAGRVTLEVAKDCKIESLSIKAKGKSEVLWTEHHNKTTVTYHSKEKFFSILQFIIQEQKGKGQDHQTLLTGQSGSAECNIVAPGKHIYPFTFQIPLQAMPSSFKGDWGKIRYTLEAKLSRSMRMSSKAMAEFPFFSRVDLYSSPELMIPQHGAKDKKMRFFTSGKVGMDVNIERQGFYLGEDIKVVASIENSSSREIKPKYTLHQKQSFFARGKRRLSTKDILKDLGEPIPPSGRQTVTKLIKIPPNIFPSINCSNIHCEYKLKIYLDVPYATDPEIKLPLVLLPAVQMPGLQPPSYSDFGFNSFGNTNQPGWNNAPVAPGAYQPAAPGAYQPMAPYQPAAPGGYQPTAPYQPAAPGGYQPAAPGAYQPAAPGAYQPTAPGTYQPAAPGACEPTAPGAYQPAPPYQPTAPGAYQPTAPGAYQPTAPGAYQPTAPGAYQPTAPGAYQPTAPGACEPTAPYQPTAPGAYQPAPPYQPAAPGGYQPTAPGAYQPTAPAPRSPPPGYGMYPSISDDAGKS
ncbi:arrestin domain-containing protein 3-like isoform X1 [Esox lucius]|uniref:Arrestin C-terminal-like domain-containing protein n=1 Tax=Esox lucius TaxID=8010 RepID=A0A3P8YLJ5_ESOLU|nr:arrestin domain-containing protein 3-like isoform X1 [Esox lucius]